MVNSSEKVSFALKEYRSVGLIATGFHFDCDQEDQVEKGSQWCEKKKMVAIRYYWSTMRNQSKRIPHGRQWKWRSFREVMRRDLVGPIIVNQSMLGKKNDPSANQVKLSTSAQWWVSWARNDRVCRYSLAWRKGIDKCSRLRVTKIWPLMGKT